MVKASFSITTIILLALSVTGCLSDGHQASWQKPGGVTQYDLDTAKSECKYQVELNGVPSDKQHDVYMNCMQGKGFRYQ
jgi:hypothetical protein